MVLIFAIETTDGVITVDCKIGYFKSRTASNYLLDDNNRIDGASEMNSLNTRY
jgi:hypothetical protein